MFNGRPNVVMVVVDSGRYDRLVNHGHTRLTTPNLLSLAEHCTDYTNANAPAGTTRFSMSSIFVGVYPETYGFSKGKMPSPDHITLAQRLRAVGYDTFLFSSDPCVSPDTGLDRGFGTVLYLAPWRAALLKRPFLLLRHWRAAAAATVNGGISYKVPVDMIVSAAVRVLRQRHSGDAPFFAYLHLDVHRPFLSDRRYLRRFLEPGVTEGEIREVERLQREPYFYASPGDLESPRKERLHSIVRSMYDASWFKTDMQIGKLISVLRLRKLFDSTMFIITSDHGEFLGERNLFRHGVFPYQEAMHVPLFVKYPKEVGKAPGPDGRLITTIDLAPTICELAGCPLSNGDTDGISLLNASRQHKFIINQRWAYRYLALENLKTRYPHGDWEKYNLGHLMALWDGRYKYVWSCKGPRFLFDLKNDPGEERDLAAEECGLVDSYEKLRSEWRASLCVREGWDQSRLRPIRRGPYSHNQ